MGAFDVSSAAKALMSGGRARTKMPSMPSHAAMMSPPSAMQQFGGARGYATPVDAPTTDYAFEVSAANLRFGEGVTVSASWEKMRGHMGPSEGTSPLL